MRIVGAAAPVGISPAGAEARQLTVAGGHPVAHPEAGGGHPPPGPDGSEDLPQELRRRRGQLPATGPPGRSGRRPGSPVLEDEPRKVHLRYQADEAQAQIGWLHVAGRRLSAYERGAGPTGSREWQPIVAMAESAPSLGERIWPSVCSGVSQMSPGSTRNNLQERCRQPTGMHPASGRGHPASSGSPPRPPELLGPTAQHRQLSGVLKGASTT